MSPPIRQALITLAGLLVVGGILATLVATGHGIAKEAVGPALGALAGLAALVYAAKSRDEAKSAREHAEVAEGEARAGRTHAEAAAADARAGRERAEQAAMAATATGRQRRKMRQQTAKA